MIDLHMHTFLSDGDLLPAELVRQHAVRGMKIIAITDHVDATNYDRVVEALARASQELSEGAGIQVVPGAEITHVAPMHVGRMVERCRSAGAAIVLVHGETVVEPVMPGTNRAGIEGGADVVAHPGLIDEADAQLAASSGVALEISARKGHNTTNGHVAALARRAGATLVFGSDAHSISDLAAPERVTTVLAGAGLDATEIETAINAATDIVRRRTANLG